MSKGSKQRPGTGYAHGYDLIKWPTDICPVCGELKVKCGCVPTEDGPGQMDADDTKKESKS